MRYLCLLRGINVSGRRKITMPDLERLCESVGFQDVSTYLTTGNILLQSDLPAHAVAARLSTAICDAFQYEDVDVAVFDAETFGRIMASAPPAAGREKGWHVTFLMSRPDPSLVAALNGEEHHPDVFHTGDGAIHVHCPNGYGRTKINNSFFERKLKVRATTRNWNTVQALRTALAGSS